MLVELIAKSMSSSALHRFGLAVQLVSIVLIVIAIWATHTKGHLPFDEVSEDDHDALRRMRARKMLIAPCMLLAQLQLVYQQLGQVVADRAAHTQIAAETYILMVICAAVIICAVTAAIMHAGGFGIGYKIAIVEDELSASFRIRATKAGYYVLAGASSLICLLALFDPADVIWVAPFALFVGVSVPPLRYLQLDYAAGRGVTTEET